MQHSLWIICGVAASVAAASIVAERKRLRRADLDKVGWVPWSMLIYISIMAAAVSAALALKT